jgi:outer membrane lipoprotein LolB
MLLSLTACVSTAFHESADVHYVYEAPSVRAARLQQLTAWHNSGAFSVKVNDKVNAANFTWQQTGRQYFRINVSSALNLVGFILTGKPNVATLVRSSDDSIQAASPEGVMQKALGWHLPLSNLYYWVRNLPAPGPFEAHQYDQYGHLQSLSQQGWQIRWRGFVTTQGLDLPRLILLSRPGVEIRIVAKQWQLSGVTQPVGRQQTRAGD